MLATRLALISGFVLAFPHMCCGELAIPVPVRVDGKPLDVGLRGGAAPFFIDFNDDGRKDLLVGEAYESRLRIYFNTGDRGEPVFQAHQFFRNGLSFGARSANGGFFPHVCDLDNDGDWELLTVAHRRNIHLFPRDEQGQFKDGELLIGVEEQPIRLDMIYDFTTIDWESDGDLDLVISGFRGGVASLFLLRNNLQNNVLRFSQPVAIESKGQPITAPGMPLSPTFADWDADGRLDLLIGCGDGSVVWYRNVGQQGVPKFEQVERLLAAPKPNEERGKQVRICVADWNDDGKLDLLLGDRGKEFQKSLTDAERTAKENATSEREEALSEWARFYQVFRKLRREHQKENTNNLGLTAAVRSQMIAARKRYEAGHALQHSIRSGKQVHGRVWIVLRK